MPIPPAIERGYMRLMDFFFDRWPRPMPAADRLNHCKLISHRGEHDNITVLENTLDAFERAAAAGAWGIELDVRWTRDGVPVVFHDADLRRLHGLPERIDRLTRQALRQRAPDIPSLGEVVDRFGSRLHLMIEIKQVQWPAAASQSRSLRGALAALAPVEAYHLMALKPEVLARLSGFPSRSLVAIAYHWPDRLSRWVTHHQWGGLCTHYALMRKSIMRRHQARGQRIGTAYPASRNCLFREINRGVDWIFTNNAARLLGLLG
jgi:glycerophosphoryl diester phosphodiesterase